MHLLGSHAPVSQLPNQDSSLPTLLFLAQSGTVASQLQTTTAELSEAKIARFEVNDVRDLA